MTKRITALFLTLVTLLSCIAVPANAATSLEEAMAEVNVYARNDDLDWLRVNGAVKVQHYTFYLYRSEQTGQTKEIPAYCTDPRLYGVPALVPEGTSIKYGADGTVTAPKIMGICANGYPHIDLATLGVQSVEEAYYATKTALWCYLLSTWDISKLSVNPNVDQAAAQRVLKATQDIYYRGMQWDKLVEPKLTATPDRDTAYAATVGGESVYQQIFTVTSETWSIEPVVLSLASGAPSGTKILDMSNNEVSRLNIANATHGDDGYTWQVKVVYPASAVAGEDGTVQINMNSVVVQYELYHAKCLETDVYGNAQRYFMVSLIIQNLYREILTVADENGGRLKNRVVFYADELGSCPPIQSLELMFSASRSRGLMLVPIVQSITGQLQKNYGKEGSEIIVDNCQVSIFGGFAPGSQTAQELSRSLGSQTILSGSVSKGRESSQTLQMMERPLMTADELKSMPKGSFVVMKTGVHPMRVRLRLFLDWGIRFGEPYQVPEKAQRPVAYAEKKELEAAITRQTRTIRTADVDEGDAKAGGITDTGEQTMGLGADRRRASRGSHVRGS